MKAFTSAIFCLVFVLLSGKGETASIARGQETKTTDAPKPVLIVVSYDGFRNEYLQRNVTPNLLKLRREGVYADYMINVFPTKTFPNHHSISTGLYPETHGVLANSLHDKEEGVLNYGYDLFHYNSDILPIWTLNEKFGGFSGCMMWPGSDFNYSGIECTHLQKYNTKIPLKDRVDTMIKWITDPEKPSNLVMFYSEQPDKLAHVVGPDSKNITDMVQQLDELTKYIQDQLEIYNLTDRANVIHLSDHGMASVSPPKFINLTNYLEADVVSFYGTSPVLQVVPVEGKEQDVLKNLTMAAKSNGNFDIYTSENLPDRWHARSNRRLGPIVAIAKASYAFQDMWEYAEKLNVPLTNSSEYGVHGYDNANELMHPFFMAKGPYFKHQQKVEPFESVDLFELFTRFLNIGEYQKRNGSLARIEDILSDRSPNSGASFVLGSILIVVVVCGLVSSVIYYIFLYYKRRRNYNITY